MTNMMKRENGHQPAAFGTMLDKVFQDNLSRFFDDSFWGFQDVDQRRQMQLNIRESDNAFQLEMVAPGLRKEDFKLNVTGNMLTVSYERKQENEQQEGEGKWLRRDFRSQSFSRSFNLDESVDATRISARYEAGVLHLELPKKEGAQNNSRVITVE
jgi:HSP20 family protein